MPWLLASVLLLVVSTLAQQQCYYAAGAEHRGPDNLVPCNGTGQSTCCLLGDTCLSGNACYNYATGDLYQYGCTDINYADETCPYKCGWDPSMSPWTALEYCSDVPQVDDVWACHAPESCGCQWNATYDLLVLEARGCSAMGSDARVALYAPSTLAPYVSLPSTHSGSTGYYSQTVISGTQTWISTVIMGYTPSSFTQFTTYRAAPSSAIAIAPGVTPAPSTWAPAISYGATPSQSLGSAASSAALSSLASSTVSTQSPTSASSAPSSVSSSVSPSPSAAADTGLSAGAKAGIGVGVVLCILLLAAVALAAYLWGQRRHPKAGFAKSMDSDDSERSPPPKLDPSSPIELSSYQRPPVGELAAPVYAQSGDGNWVPYGNSVVPPQYYYQAHQQHHLPPPGFGMAPTPLQPTKVDAPAELSAEIDRRSRAMRIELSAERRSRAMGSELSESSGGRSPGTATDVPPIPNRRAHDTASEESSLVSPLSPVPSSLRPGRRKTEGDLRVRRDSF